MAESAARFAKTAVPTRHEITCYSCGYVFPLAGRTARLICPKCRVTLDQGDYLIESEGPSVIRTTGTIRLGPGGNVKGGTLVAQKVILEGRIEEGSVRAFGNLDLLGNLSLEQAKLNARDVTIAAGSRVRIGSEIDFRNIDLRGTLHGELEIEGLVTIRPGGHLKGKIRTRHLVVEEGGGLTAQVEIRPGEETAEA